MDLSKLRISSEAMTHFQTHWLKIYKSKPKNWRRTLEKFLKNTKEITQRTPVLLPVVPDSRTRYFDNSGWLFITSGEGSDNMPITLRATARTKESF